MSLPAVIVPAVGFPAPPVLGVDDLFRSFLDSLSENTRAAYDSDLRDFARRLGFDGPQLALASLLAWGPGPANLRALEYRTSLTNAGLAPATIARRLSALRTFVRGARMVGTIFWTLEVRSPKVENYRDTAGPGRDGWHQLRNFASRRTDPKGARDLAIIRLLHDLAGRRNEVRTLDLEHVDPVTFAGFTTIRPEAVWIKGKGKVDRVRLDLPPATAAALEDWLRRRGSWPGPLFPRLDRPGSVGRMTGRSIARMVARLGADADLPKGLHPHALRHQAITAALDKTNGNVRMVQRFSRHVNVQTVLLYDDRRNDPSADVARLVADDES
jgi:integrase/recombinase XerC